MVLPLRANLSQRVVACASVPLPIAVLWRPLAFCLPPQPKRDVGTGHQWSLGKFTLDTRQFSISTRVPEDGSPEFAGRPAAPPAASAPIPGQLLPPNRPAGLKPRYRVPTAPWPLLPTPTEFSKALPQPPHYTSIPALDLGLVFFSSFSWPEISATTPTLIATPPRPTPDSAPQHLRISPFRCQARQKKPTPLTSWPTIRTTRATSPSPSRPPAPRRMPRPQQHAAS